ncbi:MAG: surface lipoprotein assembly modifier [Pseudomonadota bacterium]
MRWAVPGPTLKRRYRFALTLVAITFLWPRPLHAQASSAEQTSNAPVEATTPLRVTLQQGQVLAIQALQAGRPKLAYQLSEAVLAADPHNGEAHYTQALAFTMVGAHGHARQSAGRAYTHSISPEQKFQSAQLASQAAYKGDQLSWSQFWLRRAVQHAPNEEVRQDTIRVFQTVRHRNPLKFRLNFSIRPSNNVNNGANSPFNIIEGQPSGGIISQSAQAIDGQVAVADVNFSYRLAETERSETQAIGRIYTRQVRFNDSVPGISASDLTTWRAEGGARHIRTTQDGKRQWQFALVGGRIWYGGDPLYDYARFELDRHQMLTEKLRFSLGGALERQQGEARTSSDATQYLVYTQLRYSFANGSTLGGFVSFRDLESDGFNRSNEQITGVLRFTLGRTLGPATLSVSLGKSSVDYDSFVVPGFPFFGGPVAGGRQDDAIFAGVSAAFKEWSYMGFVPTLSLNTSHTDSNVSRFEVDETSLSLGIRSEF